MRIKSLFHKKKSKEVAKDRLKILLISDRINCSPEMMEMIKGGTTVLYVSHSLQSIKELCTRVVWLEHGKVIKIGDTKEICDEYYKKQMN